MSMPGNVLSDAPAAADFLPPDDRVRGSLLVDYEMGGAAIGDPSQGLRVQAWEGRVDAGAIQVRPDGSGSWSTVTNDTGITEIAIAFDQNMRPTVAYVAGGVAKMYWYDPVAAAYVTVSYGTVTSPVVTLDDKRPLQVGLNDVLLFYLSGGRVKHRRQRDRFTIEYDLADVPAGSTRITRWGMNEVNRVQLEFGGDPEPGAPAEGAVIGTLYTDLRTDTLYAVDGLEVAPLIASGVRMGTWRSGKFTFRSHPHFAWLRLAGPAGNTATVRIYGDGALISSQVVQTQEPVRLPAHRARLWEVEVEGTKRLTSIVVATSAEVLIRWEP